MTTDEQSLLAWALKSLAVAATGGVVWVWSWLWNGVHKDIPAQQAALNERLNREFVTKEAFVRLENDIKETFRELAERRKEMHEDTNRKLDTIITDMRALREVCSEDVRKAHQRIDEHIDRHHTK
jgi:low affinity Fe/Cu permease